MLPHVTDVTGCAKSGLRVPACGVVRRCCARGAADAARGGDAEAHGEQRRPPCRAARRPEGEPRRARAERRAYGGLAVDRSVQALDAPG